MQSEHRNASTSDSREGDDIEMLFENLPEPIDVEIDSATETLYRTDRDNFPKGNTLNKANVSGTFGPASGRECQILARDLHEPIGLKIDDVNKHIYVTDLRGTVYRYDPDGRNVKTLFHGQGEYTGIASAHLEPEQA